MGSKRPGRAMMARDDLMISHVVSPTSRLVPLVLRCQCRVLDGLLVARKHFRTKIEGPHVTKWDKRPQVVFLNPVWIVNLGSRPVPQIFSHFSRHYLPVFKPHACKPHSFPLLKSLFHPYDGVGMGLRNSMVGHPILSPLFF
jgi:hypothetical protein